MSSSSIPKNNYNPYLHNTTHSTSEGANQTAETVQATVKPPQRVYNLYSWATNAPGTRLVYVDIRDPAVAELELTQLRPGPLGFDLEWRPNYLKGASPNPVALVQLANEDVVLLVQVTAMRTFPPALRNVLQNPAYIKAGVNILNDCKKLWEDYMVNVRNCVDLALLARTVDNARWKGKYSNPIGLARLCETYHDLTLHKGKVTRSNWEALLTPIQQEYAANDCHAGLTLLNALSPLLDSIVPEPLPSFYSFDVFEGYPYQPSLLARPVMLWQAHNPFYDPGPPPPPRPPMDPNDPKRRRKNRGHGAGGGADGAAGEVFASSRHASLPPRPPPATTAAPLGLRLGAMTLEPEAGGAYHRGPRFDPGTQQQGQNTMGGHRIGNSYGNGRGRGWRPRGRGRGRGGGGSAPMG